VTRISEDPRERGRTKRDRGRIRKKKNKKERTKWAIRGVREEEKGRKKKRCTPRIYFFIEKID
jgi:hypothetical protein